MIIKKKIWPEYFDFVEAGKKQFEMVQNYPVTKFQIFNCAKEDKAKGLKPQQSYGENLFMQSDADTVEKIKLQQGQFCNHLIKLRVADFDMKEGDTLVLEEWDPKTKQYTGRKIEKQAKYILKFKLDDFGQKKEAEEHGFYVIGL